MGKIFDALEKASKEDPPPNNKLNEPIFFGKEKYRNNLIDETKLPKSVTSEPFSKKEIHISKQGKYKQKKILANLSKFTLPERDILTGEIYRSLSNNLLQKIQNQSKKSLLIISYNHGEGKTATAINLAITITDIKDYRILLVESDFRYPDIYKRIGLEQSPGLIDILEGKISLEAGIKNTTKENLKILTSGILKSHPSKLFKLKKFKEFICEAEQLFDLIIFDSPPLSRYSDANILRSQIDSVLLVVESGKTTWESLHKIETEFKDKDTEILGIIFNKHPSPKFYKRKK